jgi:adenylylsulfate kinase
MIYWFTGQPEHGKTTLAKRLIVDLEKEYGALNVFHIDGDDLRALFTNVDYSINGRVQNVNTAQRLAHYLHNQGKQVVVSLISPYIDQREEFKSVIGNYLVEFYIHSSVPKMRDKNKALAYIQPKDKYCDIDTTTDSVEQSYDLIKQYIHHRKTMV